MDLTSKKKSIIVLFVLIFGFAFYSILIIHQFLLSIDKNDNNKFNAFNTRQLNDDEYKSNKNNNNDEEASLMDKNNERLLDEIERLKEKIALLEQELVLCEFENEMRKNKKFLNDEEFNLESINQRFNTTFPDNLLMSKIQEKFIQNEGDIYPYSAFTLDKYFPAELGIYNRVAIQLTGFRLNDFHTVLKKTAKNFNLNVTNFLIGFFRSTPIDGNEYELYFQHSAKNTQQKCCFKVRLNKPLETLRIIDYSVDINKDTVNFILPLHGDLKIKKSLQTFLSVFEKVAVKQDKHVTLTIVHSKRDNFNNLIEDFKKRANFMHVNLVQSAAKFNRAFYLDLGVKYLNKSRDNDLLFFADVDIVFNGNFLEQCRSNTVRNKRVFFPVLFSLFNPKMLNSSSNAMELTISKETGYWRDTGFGMVCLRREDYFRVGGFEQFLKSKSENGEQWGGEDLFLYRLFFKADLEIYRAVSPGLFHLYHEKVCDKRVLSREQYRNCVLTKISAEASIKTFGLTYFNLTQSFR